MSHDLVWTKVHTTQRIAGVAALLLAAGQFAPALAADDVRPLSSSWLQDARSGWAELSRLPAPCQWKGAENSHSTNGNPYSRTSRFQLRRDGESVVCVDDTHEVSTQGVPSEISNAWGINSDYAFRLKRASPERPWVIRSLVKPDAEQSAELAEIKRVLHIYTNSIELSAILIHDESLPAMFSNEHVTIGVPTTTQRDGTPLARIPFEVDLPHDFVTQALGVRSFKNLQSGVLFLDPRKQWRIASAELVLKSGETITKTYSIAENPLQLCPNYVMTNNNSTGVYETTMTVDDIATECRFTEDDFRVSAFGLSEPVGVLPPPTRRWSWHFGLLGVGVLLVGFWLLRRSRAAA